MDGKIVCSAMLDSLPVYVPLESLTEPVVQSIISIAAQKNDYQNDDFSQRTLLIFLLAINEKLNKIENNSNTTKKDDTDTTEKDNPDATEKDNADTTEKEFDEQIIQHAKEVRRWLVGKNNQPLHWDKLQEKYDKIADLIYGNSKPYHELTDKTWSNDVKRSRRYMNKSRQDGYKPEELKLYWNAEQLENLCPKPGEQSERTPPHDPSDSDAVQNLRKFPVSDRNHRGTITYITDGIQKAVFAVPENAQIIVLNFANEQSPGGGYLRNARAQEEVLLYNSDGYRSLLDLKYGRMGGGYAIPEFGLAYVRDICIYDSKSEDKCRKADMMVSACYCMNGAELYDNPQNFEKWEKNNLEKFRAFMAAAVANTLGNGKETYLLLGPIGTGAFGNDVDHIAEVFRKVLEMPMMNSKGPIRYAFEHIWFVSIDGWKNDIFEKVLPANEPKDTENN